jgi:hypothetical protein
MTSAKQQLPREVPPPAPVILGCGEARIAEEVAEHSSYCIQMFTNFA